MTYHQHRVFEIRKIFLQPSHRIHIQIIGRFIQQQVIRITVKCLCQHDTHLFLTAQFPHQHIMLVFLYAQPTQQRSSITLGIPTIQFGKLLFQFRNFQAIFICKISFRIQFFTLFHNVPQHSMSHHNRIHDCIFIPLKVILAQYRQTFARS